MLDQTKLCESGTNQVETCRMDNTLGPLWVGCAPLGREKSACIFGSLLRSFPGMQSAAVKLSTGITAEQLALPPDSSQGGSAQCTSFLITSRGAPQAEKRTKGASCAFAGSNPSCRQAHALWIS